MNIIVFRFAMSAAGQPPASQDEIRDAFRALTMMPVASVYGYWNLVFPNADLLEVPNYQAASLLQLMQQAAGGAGRDRNTILCGILPANSGKTFCASNPRPDGGCSAGVSPPPSAQTPGNRWMLTRLSGGGFAHELVHNFASEHTNDEAKYPGGPRRYPPIGVFGVDPYLLSAFSRVPEAGDAASAIFPPTTVDFMDPNAGGWISPFYWARILNQLPP